MAADTWPWGRVVTSDDMIDDTVYPKKYAHGFVVLCFVVVMQSFIMNSHEEFIHIRQGCFAGTGAIVRLPQCQWSKPDGYGKISQCITTTKHSKAKTVCIFLGIYCTWKTCLCLSLFSTSTNCATSLLQIMRRVTLMYVYLCKFNIPTFKVAIKNWGHTVYPAKLFTVLLCFVVS